MMLLLGGLVLLTRLLVETTLEALLSGAWAALLSTFSRFPILEWPSAKENHHADVVTTHCLLCAMRASIGSGSNRTRDQSCRLA